MATALSKHLYLIADIGGYGISQVASGLAPVCLLTVLAVLLPSQTLGEFVLLQSMMTILSPVMLMGANSRLARIALDGDVAAIRQCLANCIFIASVSTIVLLLAALCVVASTTMLRPHQMQYAFLVPLICFLNTFPILALDIWQMQRRSHWHSLLRLSQSLLVVVCGIAGTYTSREISGTLHGLTIAAGTIGLISLCAMLKMGLLGSSPNLASLRSDLSFGMPVLSYIIATYAVLYADRFLIARFCGLSATGAYGIATQLASAVNMVVTPICTAAPPWIHSLMRSGPTGRKTLARLTIAYGGVVCVVALAARIVVPYVLAVMRQEQESVILNHVSWLIPAVAFASAIRFFSIYLHLSHRTGVLGAASLSSAAVTVPLNLLLIPIVGPVGASQASFCTQAIGALCMIQLARILAKAPTLPQYETATDQIAIGGRDVHCDRVYREVPGTCFQLPLHAFVCTALARQTIRGRQLQRVYINSLFQFSLTAKNITSLIVLIDSQRIQVADIPSVKLRAVVEAIRDSWRHGAEIPSSTSLSQYLPPRLLDTVTVQHLLKKALIHWAFRARRKAIGQGWPKSIVRAWVEISEDIHREQFESSTILIFPSAAWRRQLRFIRSCYARFKHVTVWGVPYSIRSIGKVFLSGRRRDRALLLLEIQAHRKLAAELLAIQPVSIRTSDEFIPGALVLFRGLSRLGIRGINAAHGVGIYGPYVNHTDFECFTQQQLNFYSQFNASTSLTLSPIAPVGIDKSLRTIPYTAPLPLAVVYIHQFAPVSDCPYETNLQDRILNQLASLSAAEDPTVLIKLHPSVTRSEHNRLQRTYPIHFVQDLRSLENRQILFINMCSTAYYTFAHFGKTLFVCDDLHDPRVLFGNEIDLVHVDSLADQLRKYPPQPTIHSLPARIVA